MSGSTTPEMVAKMSRTILARQITEGWKLVRGPAGRASLVYEHGDPVDSDRYSLHLSAHWATSSSWRSRFGA